MLTQGPEVTKQMPYFSASGSRRKCPFSEDLSQPPASSRSPKPIFLRLRLLLVSGGALVGVDPWCLLRGPLDRPSSSLQGGDCLTRDCVQSPRGLQPVAPGKSLLSERKDDEGPLRRSVMKNRGTFSDSLMSVGVMLTAICLVCKVSTLLPTSPRAPSCSTMLDGVPAPRTGPTVASGLGTA